MAKTIFTGKKVKEFSFQQGFTMDAPIQTKFPWFFEYFFVGNCPCNTCDWYSKYKKPKSLKVNCHCSNLKYGDTNIKRIKKGFVIYQDL
jgi:hypothetical protein